jgi:hypothetical protein
MWSKVISRSPLLQTRIETPSDSFPKRCIRGEQCTQFNGVPLDPLRMGVNERRVRIASKRGAEILVRDKPANQPFDASMHLCAPVHGPPPIGRELALSPALTVPCRARGGFTGSVTTRSLRPESFRSTTPRHRTELERVHPCTVPV